MPGQTPCPIHSHVSIFLDKNMDGNTNGHSHTHKHGCKHSPSFVHVCRVEWSWLRLPWGGLVAMAMWQPAARSGSCQPCRLPLNKLHLWARKIIGGCRPQYAARFLCPSEWLQQCQLLLGHKVQGRMHSPFSLPHSPSLWSTGAVLGRETTLLHAYPEGEVLR